MRRFILAIAAAAALFVVPASSSKAEPGAASGMTDISAQRIEFGPGGVRIDDGRRRGGPDCGELRAACEQKDRLGERGEGNCRRYRELCAPRPSRAEVCRELRSACLNKERLGERGEGNCRQYRETCR
jgi:hypothetical protein